MIRAAGDGEHRWFLGVLSTLKVSGKDTDGRLAVMEMTFPRGASPPLHTHPQDETFYLLEGDVLAWEGSNGAVRLEPGGLLCAPAGTPHSFRVESETARMLILSTTSGIEDFVRDLSVPADGPTLPPAEAWRPTKEERSAAEAKHEQIFVGPPPA
jgi:quercetin dioxygenase-like cupin family protein